MPGILRVAFTSALLAICILLSLFIINEKWDYRAHLFHDGVIEVQQPEPSTTPNDTSVEHPIFKEVDQESENSREQLKTTLDAGPEKAIVMARLSSENTTWIEELSELVQFQTF